MELQRRYGAGRLAEIFGPQAVAIDRQMRVLGLYRAAEAEIPFLSPAMKRALDAYAAGVNAFLQSRRGALPPEFLLLGFAPEPWRPADSLIWGKLMALQVGGNYRGELLRARMARTISAADLAFLYPGIPERCADDARRDGRRSIAGWRSTICMRRCRRSWGRTTPRTTGSSMDGTAPAASRSSPTIRIWPLLRRVFGTSRGSKTPQHKIAGATAAGVPLVVIGHNERIAWGFTTTTADVEDLFIEKVDPADPGRYRDAARERAVQIPARDHRCEGRGAGRHHDPRDPARPGDCPTSCRPARRSQDLSWPWRRPSRSPMTAAPRQCGRSTAQPIGRASETALRHFVGPIQNMVYADVDGTIGFIAPGLVPIRRNGQGWLPAPGWTGDYDWTGFIPFEELPSAVNPPSGHFRHAPTTRSCRTAIPIS